MSKEDIIKIIEEVDEVNLSASQSPTYRGED